MEDLRNLSMEEKKQAIQLHMNLLKDLLVKTGMAIAFDKTNDNLMFIDREIYLTEKRAEGFQIAFNELTY